VYYVPDVFFVKYFLLYNRPISFGVKLGVSIEITFALDAKTFCDH